MTTKRNKIIFYRTESIKVEFEVHFEDETFWLTQKKMGELFGVEVNTINYHLKEIYKSGELSDKATIRKIRIVQKEQQKMTQIPSLVDEEIFKSGELLENSVIRKSRLTACNNKNYENKRLIK